MNKISDSKTVVIKVGTSTLTHSTGMFNLRRVENLVKVLSDLKNLGKDIILVTSGAIGIGCGKLGLANKPTDIPSKQAIAAIGQCELMYFYDRQFAKYNHTVAQVLMTKDGLNDTDRITNCKNTLTKLLDLGVIPIINENDTMSVEEIKFGDNDTLSAVVASIVDADLHIILSDIDGLYDKNPSTNSDAKLIPVVNEINDDIISLAGTSGSEYGTGGMITKINAAEISNSHGIDMIIANGQDPNILYDLFENKPIGTIFISSKEEKE